MGQAEKTGTHRHAGAGGDLADGGLDLLAGLAVLVLGTIGALTPVLSVWTLPAGALLAVAIGARSAWALDRADHHPTRVTVRHLSGVLPVLWCVAVAALPVVGSQIWLGRDPAQEIRELWRPLITWLLPLAEPDISGGGADELVARLWLLRALVWLILISPALVFGARHWPGRTLGAIGLVAVLTAVQPADAYPGLATRVGQSVTALGIPWLLGVLRQDGRAQHWHPGWAVPLAVLVGAGGAAGLVLAPPPGPDDPAITPLRLAAAAVLAGGVALLSVVLTPQWPGRARRWSPRPALTVLADRAVTVFLWSGLAGWVVASALAAGQRSGWLPPPWRIPGLLAGTWLAVLVVAAFLGWIEDLGNGRPLRLVPRRAPDRRRRFRTRMPATRVGGNLSARAVADGTATDDAVPGDLLPVDAGS